MKAIEKENPRTNCRRFNYNLLNHKKANTVTEFMNFISSNLL